MIYNIKIKNFKSHKESELHISNLTVLCGKNGVGKSSIVQSLLLLRESFIKDKSFENLDLIPNPVKIGTVDDAIYEFGEIDGFEFTINDLELNYEVFSAEERTKTFVNLNKSKSKFNIESCNNESLFNTNFQYISAGRIGPQKLYVGDDKIVDVYKQISLNNGMCEFFVHYLYRYSSIDVNEEICFDLASSKYKDLFSQVFAWEKFICDGANIKIEKKDNLGYLLTYSFDNEQSTSRKTKNFEALNVGFGLSYILPILVAILSSKPGSLVIIENPEAHLHPSAISRLTELICLASQSGIQIIIETHSDHVINGVLVQCKKFEIEKKGINKDYVSLYQVERNEIEHSSVVEKIEILENGFIKNAPLGFFDQFRIDSDFLFY